MDGNRFDAVTKLWATPSRRRVMCGFLGGAASLLEPLSAWLGGDLVAMATDDPSCAGLSRRRYFRQCGYP